MKINLPISIIGFSATLFLLVILYLWIFDTASAQLDDYFIQEPLEQTNADRIWKEVEVTDFATHEEPLAISSLTFGRNGFLYAGDTANMVINKYDTNLTLVKTLGRGEGRGPGEFLTVHQMFPDKQGNVWVTDNSNSRFTILYNSFEKENEWEIRNPSGVPLSVIPFDSEEYVTDYLLSGQLSRYSKNHEPLFSYQHILRQPERWRIIQQGNYTPVYDDRLLKVFTFTNNILMYASDGTISYLREPILPPELPVAHPSPEQSQPGEREYVYDFTKNEQFSSAVSVVGNQIHIFITKRTDQGSGANIFESNEKFIDVYSLDAGEYMYSYKIPNRVTNFTTNGEYAAGIDEETGFLRIWSMTIH